MTMTQFFKNYNKDRVRSARREFDTRCEELALSREQAQRQFDASLQQNQIMTTMMQFMMVSFLFFHLSRDLFTVLIILSTAAAGFEQ